MLNRLAFEISLTFINSFTGMKRVVVINSYQSIKDSLISKATDFAGRPHDSIPFKIASYNFTDLGAIDYSPKWVFLRKLAFKSLHMYGDGMKRIEEIFSEEIDYMCSHLSKDLHQPIMIHQHLGK